ncbi:MAG: GFA family protein [Sphingomonadaceae bacterium]|nr:GFA family protein [Sphingomonadaceae bacterium]
MLDCNCSICSKSGYLHLAIPHEDFMLESGTGALASYRFGTGAAEHLFCRTCGIKSFYQPRSHPDCWSINMRCLDEGHGIKGEIPTFDGRNWDAANTARQQKG